MELFTVRVIILTIVSGSSSLVIGKIREGDRRVQEKLQKQILRCMYFKWREKKDYLFYSSQLVTIIEYLGFLKNNSKLFYQSEDSSIALLKKKHFTNRFVIGIIVIEYRISSRNILFHEITIFISLRGWFLVKSNSVTNRLSCLAHSSPPREIRTRANNRDNVAQIARCYTIHLPRMVASASAAITRTL